MGVYDGSGHGYMYGDAEGGISIGHNYQNAEAHLLTTQPGQGASKIHMYKDTIVSSVGDAAQDDLNDRGPTIIGWSVKGNGLDQPASVGIGTEDPSGAYALDISGSSHTSGACFLSTSTKLYGDGSGNTLITNTERSPLSITPVITNVAVGSSNQIIYNRNNTGWNNSLNGNALFTTCFCVAYGNGRWVAGGQGPHALAYSSDARVWTGVNYFMLSPARCIAYNDISGMWIAGGTPYDSYSNYAYSYNGINWLPGRIIFGSGNNINSIAWNGSYWLAGTALSDLITPYASIAKSYDGLTWTTVNINSVLPGCLTLSYARNRGLWIAGGTGTGQNTTDPRIATSIDDGVTWTPVTDVFNTTNYSKCTSIVYDGSGTWVAGGGYVLGPASPTDQQLAYSTDGSNWIVTSSGEILLDDTRAVLWDGYQWTAAAQNGSAGATLATSPTGQLWTAVPNSISYISGCYGLATNTVFEYGGNLAANIVTINPTYSDFSGVLISSNASLTLGSDTGALYVTNGINTGQVYDTQFNTITGAILNPSRGPMSGPLLNTAMDYSGVYYSSFMSATDSSGSGTLNVNGTVQVGSVGGLVMSPNFGTGPLLSPTNDNSNNQLLFKAASGENILFLNSTTLGCNLSQSLSLGSIGNYWNNLYVNNISTSGNINSLSITSLYPTYTNTLLSPASPNTGLLLGPNSTNFLAIDSNSNLYPQSPYNLGILGHPWSNLYVNNINTGTIAGTGVIASSLPLASRGTAGALWYAPTPGASFSTTYITNTYSLNPAYTCYLIIVSFSLVMNQNSGTDPTSGTISLSYGNNVKQIIGNTQNGQNTTYSSSVSFIMYAATPQSSVSVVGNVSGGLQFRITDVNDSPLTTVDIIGLC